MEEPQYLYAQDEALDQKEEEVRHHKGEPWKPVGRKGPSNPLMKRLMGRLMEPKSNAICLLCRSKTQHVALRDQYYEDVRRGCHLKVQPLAEEGPLQP